MTVPIGPGADVGGGTGDETLARQVAEGSHRAFEKLVLRWEDRLYRFLLARTGSVADAQDALQESFVAAWRYRGTYRSRFRYSTWLYRIALREAARLHRRKSPDGGDPESIEDAATGPAAGLESDPWHIARQHLSAQAFTVMWLRYHEDWTAPEIARCLLRPAAWVRLSLHRSRNRLAAVMEDPE